MDGSDTSSSESNEYHEHNIWEPLLEHLCHTHIGVFMEAYFDEVDMGRILLSCHFYWMYCVTKRPHCPSERSILHHFREGSLSPVTVDLLCDKAELYYSPFLRL